MTGTMGIATEALAIGLILAVLLAFRRYTNLGLQAVERGFGRIGRKPGMSIAMIGLLAMGASAAVSLLGSIAPPRVHDEFSYLLAADTFASGRLTNPTHPLWQHFESIHIIQRPTYASKYPPAQGLMLAAGQVIVGHPIVGVWIGIALACAALCWMLLAWLPPKWAMMGSLIAVLHPGVLLMWGQTYWGGQLAMMGGALVFGAVRRLVRRPRMSAALLLGVGLAVLANSRPYEGLVVSLPVAVVLLAWMFGQNAPPLEISIKLVVLPILAVLVFAAGAMCYYNLRVTGEFLRMPYFTHEETYAMAPYFLWQSPRPEPKYRHEIIKKHHLNALRYYLEQQSVGGLFRKSIQKSRELWNFYRGKRSIWLSFLIPWLMLPWLLRNQWARLALLSCGLLIAAGFLETWLQPHYLAPAVGLMLVLVLQQLRYLHSWRLRGLRLGRFIVWTLCALIVTSFTIALVQRIQVQSFGWGSERARILAQLNGDARRHVMIVRYPFLDVPYDRGLREWVYNEADIDSAKIVWAREMDAAQNRKLLEYFKDRVAWLVEVDQYDSPPKLLPYPLLANR